jgi:hypothetical protein
MVETAKQEILSALGRSLVILSGISSKTNKPYEVFAVARNARFNPTLIQLAKEAGIQVFEVKPKATTAGK